MVKKEDLFSCTGSASGEHNPDRSGKCVWCSRWVEVPMPKPKSEKVVSELEHYYHTMWDPDYDGTFHDEWRY